MYSPGLCGLKETKSGVMGSVLDFLADVLNLFDLDLA